MKNTDTYPIDIVLPWVDGSDMVWLNEKKKYCPDMDPAYEAARYRDWGLLKYWFRAIEKNAPWVNKIHFITYGHIPSWLNTKNEKINIVKHSDYIPKEYLPTFSSHVIEINLHRIKELSEHFIYLNDDVYIMNSTKKEDFFLNGLPRARSLLHINCVKESREIQFISNNSIALLNDDYDFRSVYKKNIRKWLTPKYGLDVLRNIWLFPCPRLPGLKHDHINSNFLKTTIADAWTKYNSRLEETSRNKFRKKTDLNQYLFQDINVVTGNFYPQKKIGEYIDFHDENALDRAKRTILSGNKKIVCLNDSPVVNEDEYEKISIELKECFEKKFPKKSVFEI